MTSPAAPEFELFPGCPFVGDHPTVFLAEGGLNHNGDMGIAKELIEKAKLVGADAIKFHKRTTNAILMRGALKALYMDPNSFGETYGEHRERLEFSEEQWVELVCAATGYRGGLAFEEGAVDGPLRRTADTSRYRGLCPENKDLDLFEGIKGTVEWYRKTQASGDKSAAFAIVDGAAAAAVASGYSAATAFARVSLAGPGKADQGDAPAAAFVTAE